MLRCDLSKFISEKEGRELFLQKIETETDEYRRQLKRSGSVCPIHLSGAGAYEVTFSDALDVADYLGSYPEHVRDYVLNAILLDNAARKSEETIDLLEELTAPNG